MNYWLVKSEPHKYAWEQFLKDKKTFWDGGLILRSDK
jgi:predicted RNA-binding protein with PUA-like domain